MKDKILWIVVATCLIGFAIYTIQIQTMYSVTEAKAEEVMDESVSKVKPKEAQIAVYPTKLGKIADCESGDGTDGSARQFYEDGSVVIGKYTKAEFGKDVGKHQVNEKVWGKKARELGYDIYTDGGNDLMAIWIYERHGSGPWSASRKCWVS